MGTNLIHWRYLLVYHDGEALCSLGKFIEKYGDPESSLWKGMLVHPQSGVVLEWGDAHLLHPEVDDIYSAPDIDSSQVNWNGLIRAKADAERGYPAIGSTVRYNDTAILITSGPRIRPHHGDVVIQGVDEHDCECVVCWYLYDGWDTHTTVGSMCEWGHIGDVIYLSN